MKRSGEVHREQPKQKRQDHSGTGQREPKRLRVTFSPYLEASASDRGGVGATGGGFHTTMASAGGIRNHQHQEPQPRAAPQAAQSPARSNSNNNPQQQRGTSSPASILRMTSHHHQHQPSLASRSSPSSSLAAAGTATASSSSSSSAPTGVASRFTFDFVDNISSASSALKGGKKKAIHNHHHNRSGSSSSARSINSASGSSTSSPKGVNHQHTANCLSPSRLDPRYASRLPPSYYSPSNNSKSISSNSSRAGGGTPRSHSLNSSAQKQNWQLQHRGTTTTSLSMILANGNNSKQGGVGDAEAEALVNRNLFGTTTTTTTADIDMAVDDISGGINAMDVSPRRMMGDGSGGTGIASSSSSPPSSQGGGGGRRSLHNTPTFISTLGGNTTTSNTYYSHQSSPTATAASVASTTTHVKTFVSSSPSIRRRGLITGITSPLSGNLSRKDAAIRAAAASSLSSAMSLSSSSHHTMNDENDDDVDDGNSSGMGGGWNNSNISTTTTTQHTQSPSTSMNYLLDYERRSGAGDRYIPSRALSNLNFELSTSGGGNNSISSSLTQRTLFSRGGSNGGIVGDITSDVFDTTTADTMINPVPSFGATMMGGGGGGTATAVDDASPPGDSGTTGGGAGGATTGAAAARGADAVASTFSDDGLTADRESDWYGATNRQPLLYDALLRSELLGENIDPASMNPTLSPANGGSSSSGNVDGGWRIIGASNNATPFRECSNNLRFNPSRQYYHNSMYGLNNNSDNHGISNNSSRLSSSIVNSFQLSPLSMSPNQRITLGSYTERCKRKIAKVPTKVLDAPALQDDFYLNLVDWSSLNVLAVGLGSSVYLWSAATSKVTQLCDLSPTEDAITSVAWSEGGRHLAIGITKGDVQIWDASAQKLIRTMTGHSARVGALSWKLSGVAGGGGGGGDSSSLLASGSRDRIIYLRDPRSDSSYEMRLCGHKQEVCGLRWSFDERSMLASGGNDNKLLIWDVKKHTTPMHAFADHTAAVKAIAWSPHQNGLLASGGGTADRCIRFWNCLTGHGISSIDTGSQVCNLAFSKNCNELVSTHGYSLNQIVVWKYPSMQKIATLTGHTYRVLYLALSPDGSTIVTGAGDETLRFWQVFPGPQKENKAGGLLFPAGMPGSIIR